MKVAINITPLKSAHKDRGIGNYASNLLNELKKEQNIKIQEFVDYSEIKDADIIHYPWFDFFFRTLPNSKKIPLIVTIHDVIPLKFKANYPVGLRGKINLFLQKRALKNCKAVITDSKTSSKDIIQFLGIKSEKIKVIPLAADSDFKILPQSKLIHARRKFNLANRFLLYVGDANWVKNLPFLIQAFKNLTDNSLLKDLKLVLVGSVYLKNVEQIDHPELDSLKKVNSLIKEYNLEDKILRVGKIERDDLVCLYNLAEIYVQPSLYEGFGLPVLEAMSCGTPVLSSNGGSLPEVGGEAVIYFDPRNTKQFESLVIEMLGSKSLQEKLSRLGLKQVEKFNWKLVSQKTLEVYSNVTHL